MGGARAPLRAAGARLGARVGTDAARPPRLGLDDGPPARLPLARDPRAAGADRGGGARAGRARPEPHDLPRHARRRGGAEALAPGARRARPRRPVAAPPEARLRRTAG